MAQNYCESSYSEKDKPLKIARGLPAFSRSGAKINKSNCLANTEDFSPIYPIYQRCFIFQESLLLLEYNGCPHEGDLFFQYNLLCKHLVPGITFAVSYYFC